MEKVVIGNDDPFLQVLVKKLSLKQSDLVPFGLEKEIF